MNAIEISHLKKYFGQVKAVDDISFVVEKGEIFGFLGPNGAGKTTTISCLMGFIAPTEGTITILGKDSQKNRTNLKNEIGYLSSDVHLYKNLTGWDHINLIQSIRGKSPILKKLLKDFQFDPSLPVHHLSTGTKQKLGIILCLMNQPKLLVLDEPTRGLDPLLQNIMYEYILDFQKKGTTVFMSSHILNEVEKLCHHVGIIRSGKLQAVETITSLRQKRIHVVRATFKKPLKYTTFSVPGVDEVTTLPDGSIEFRLKGDIDPVIQTLSKYSLSDLDITHASLEEIFMEYYQRDLVHSHPEGDQA